MKFPGYQKVLTRPFRSLAALVLFFCATLTAIAGFSIQNGLLYDDNGNEFIMRGINFPHVWYPTQTATSIPNIAATGANSVRLVLGAGKQWGPNPAADVAALIELCKANKLIAIVEVHDCTGFGEAAAAAPLSFAVDYWISIQDVLKGQENFVIINIANEPLGNGQPPAKWVTDHTEAITRLRAAGFTHTLMVDAANWGQDWQQTMLTNAPVVFNSDPLKNTIFSVHMYEVYAARPTIQNYLSTFVTAGLPICVGEFGADHQGQPVDEASILEISETLGVGYIGWSWSGNTGGTESLDIALNFNPATLSPWGTTLLKSFNGIGATSQLSTVFGDVPRLQLSPSTLALTVAGQAGTVAVNTTRPWTATDNQPWITLSPTSGATAGNLVVTAAPNPDLAPRSGVVTVTAGGLTRTIRVNQVGTGGAGVCFNAVPITLPFVHNGAGEFCWVTSGTITSINCWSTQAIEINGVSFPNGFSNVLPPRINGNYYIRLSAVVPFAHLEIAGNGGVISVPATGVTLTPSTLSLQAGASSPLTATVAPATATNKGINWRSSNPAVATVNSSGGVTGVANGSATITATTQDGGFIASSVVTVGSVVVQPQISISPATATVGIGTTTILTAALVPANVPTPVTWTSSNPAVAQVSTTGVVTGVSVGVATITARRSDNGLTATSQVTVTDVVILPTSVSVQPFGTTLPLGNTFQLTATVLPNNATNKTVIWTSSNPLVATVSASGLVTSVAAGQTTITGRTQSANLTASSVITIVGGPAPVVAVSPRTATVLVGATTTLTATVIPATPVRPITWSSDNLAVATVSSAGVVTGVAAGTATIRALVAGGGSTPVTITVTNVTTTPCASPVARTLPLVQNGVGDFCYVISGNVSFVNSWNMQRVEINGVDFTNKWANSLPPRIDGNYYIRYVSNVAWAHLEVNAAP